ncbi:HET-domain-containing protein, partial [Acephala macrosclerotiorum]
TVQDAALITTQLGIKYLWVDRFCIVQDDVVDVEMEIVQMPEIYYNAELTISATRADCAEKGFYPLDCRARTFQESLLSRRILHFTLREIQWECQAVPDSEKPDVHPWQGLVEEYTLRQMKYPKDRARAISGIAAKFAARTGDSYCAGLWRSTFTSQLGWFCLKRQEHSRRLQELNAPSWSWLSVNGPVCFLANHLSPSLEVVNVEVKLKNSEASFGDVKLGHVTVKGLI